MMWITVLALVSANASIAPQWQPDYSQARATVSIAHKPMAVFVGSGTTGWEKVAKEGTLEPKAMELLAGKYVCVYIDRSTDAGRQFATKLDIASEGLVITNRDGNLQAFSHAGSLDAGTLKATLEKYSAPTHVVYTTESTAAPVVTPAPVVVTTPAPVMMSAPSPAPSMMIINGQAVFVQPSCPNGNCPYARK